MFILDRAKHIKASLRANCNEDKSSKKQADHSPAKDESCERILNELRENLSIEHVKLIEELFMLEGIFFDPNSVEALESAYEDVTLRTISTLQKAVEDLAAINEKLMKDNSVLKTRLTEVERFNAHRIKVGWKGSHLHKIFEAISYFIPSVGHSFSLRCRNENVKVLQHPNI